MEVFLTVDTECTEERSTRAGIRPPLGYDRMMHGRLSNHSLGWGTDFLVRELVARGLSATFFVEALCAGHFGVDGLSGVVQQLTSAQQDVQLQLHPNFRRPQWRHTGGQPLPDNIGDYLPEEQVEMLRAGIDILCRAGVPRDSVMAFRAGNFGASDTTIEALAQVGLVLDSSLNMAYLALDCGLRPDRPRVALYRASDRVYELPLSCIREPGGGYRPLQITAMTLGEMSHSLNALRRSGAQTATILTHPSEFFVIDDHRAGVGRVNQINVRRWQGLLDFLTKNSSSFRVRTARDLAEDLKAGIWRPSDEPSVVPSGSPRYRAVRVLSQAVKRTLYTPRD